MQNHCDSSSNVIHDIPDMSQTPLRALILRIASERMAPARAAGTLKGAAVCGRDSDEIVVDIMTSLFAEPKNETDFIEGLQWMGAAFTQAYSLNTPPPENLSQSQWNRALRDQGERLRAASLTLGAGQETIAADQLAVVTQFLSKHLADLPA